MKRHVRNFRDVQGVSEWYETTVGLLTKIIRMAQWHRLPAKCWSWKWGNMLSYFLVGLA